MKKTTTLIINRQEFKVNSRKRKFAEKLLNKGLVIKYNLTDPDNYTAVIPKELKCDIDNKGFPWETKPKSPELLFRIA